MKLEFTVPFRRAAAPTTLLAEPTPELRCRPPRISRLVALAHKLDGLVRSGTIADYGELARLGHICPARLCQIMVLLHLAPSIREYVLFLAPADTRFVTELGLRRSRVSRSGTANANYSSRFSTINLLLRAR